MSVMVFDSWLDECGEMNDLPPEAHGKNILFVGAREGQVLRVRGMGYIACGWWDLVQEGFLNSDHTVNVDALEQFDVIVFEHPRRVYAPIRHIYRSLIDDISKLLKSAN